MTPQELKELEQKRQKHRELWKKQDQDQDRKWQRQQQQEAEAEKAKAYPPEPEITFQLADPHAPPARRGRPAALDAGS